mgnify:CR=1 FL=1
MKYITLLAYFLITINITAQCNTCIPVNENGNFESQNNILGTENANGVATGEIKNWYNTHGTADYFDSSWNWYGIQDIDSNYGHLCYGNRPTHDHSEGMYTPVEILADEDLTYCVSLDYGSHCPSENYGQAHIYLTNHVSQGGANGFMFPTEQTHGIWFEDSKKVDVITLDEESDFTTIGMTTHNTIVTPEQSYSQLWIFTEYLHTAGGFVDCGLMIDNVKVTCQTDALIDLKVENLSGDKYEIMPKLNKQLSGVEHEWKLDGLVVGNEASEIIELIEGSYELCLDIKDDRGACASLCKAVNIGDTQTQKADCNYTACLDAAGGVPVINSLSIVLPTGEEMMLDYNTVGFGFPYCIGASTYCASGEYELDYLITDVNNWMAKNNYKGSLAKGGDASYTDGCRGHQLAWIQSEVQFSSINVEDITTGDQFVIYTNQSNCTAEKDEEIVKKVIAHIEVFPNPTVDIAQVQFESEVSDAKILLLDASGTIITDQAVTDTSSVQLDMSEQGTGIYYVQVNSDNSSYTERIIKL